MSTQGLNRATHSTGKCASGSSPTKYVWNAFGGRPRLMTDLYRISQGMSRTGNTNHPFARAESRDPSQQPGGEVGERCGGGRECGGVTGRGDRVQIQSRNRTRTDDLGDLKADAGGAERAAADAELTTGCVV